MSVSLATLGTASMLAFWLAWMISFHFVIVAELHTRDCPRLPRWP